MLSIGQDCYVSKEKILVITGIDAAPLKRARQNANETNKLIDCTKGHKTRSLIHLEGGFVVESANIPETLKKRLKDDIEQK